MLTTCIRLQPASACYAQMSGGFGLLALCEVGLGDHPPFEAFKYSVSVSS